MEQRSWKINCYCAITGAISGAVGVPAVSTRTEMLVNGIANGIAEAISRGHEIQRLQLLNQLKSEMAFQGS